MSEQPRVLRRILLTGLPASGKSTAATLLGQSRPDVRVLEIGAAMAALAVGERLVATTEELATIGAAERARLQVAAASAAARIGGPLVVVAHLVVLGPEGYLPGLPEAARDAICPDAVVMLTCEASTLVQRRAQGNRPRTQPLETAERILAHQQLTREAAEQIASAQGAPLIVLAGEDSPRGIAASVEALLAGPEDSRAARVTSSGVLAGRTRPCAR